MAFIDEFATYLAAQLGGSYAVGTNVFKNSLPKLPVVSLALIQSGGESAHQVTDIFTPFYRLLARATNGGDANTNFELAFAVINRMQNVTLTNYEVFFAQSIDSGPKPIENDANIYTLESWFRVNYKTIES